MDEAKRRWRKELPLFPLGRRFLDEDRRIPLGKEDAVAFQFEPALHKVNLGGFAGSIQTLDSDEFS